MSKIIHFDWVLGFSDNAEVSPERYFPAHVPGAVQKDVAADMKLKPFYVGTEFKKLKFCEDKFWHYKTELSFVTETNEIALLHFDGIDYSCSVYINGEYIASHTGMFSQFEIDVTNYSGKKNTLEVVILPVPKCIKNDTRDEARESCKSDACYGWDWHPRLISSGLWGDAFLEIGDGHRFKEAEIKYRLDDLCNNALIRFSGIANGDRISVTLSGNGKAYGAFDFPVLSDNTFSCSVNLDDIGLWYPTGYGEQPVYTFKALLYDNTGHHCDTYIRKIGFRRSKLVMNEGSWNKPDTFPKSRSDAPAQLEINGIKVFAKGSNWVNAEVFPSDMSEEKYRELLTLVKNANMNILRVWGGGFVNKESFFDLCDEMGIMVWQEFPLACNEYPDKDSYLDILEQEATAIVKRLRTHPCVVLWCGGNELFNNWSGMTDQHHALRLLNSICYKEDRFTPFIATSPLMGMSHGHYTSFDKSENKETIEMFRNAQSTAYTEFGTPSLASEKVLRMFASEDDLKSFNAQNDVWREHHAFNAWLDGSWTDLDAVMHFYGDYGDIHDIIKKTQAIQSMNYKACFEEMRRQAPHCAMAINWCLNEPWPTAANNSIISWGNEPKPAYYAIKDALRPTLASLETSKLLFHACEVFRGRVWILNDSPACLTSGRVDVFLTFGEKTHCCGNFFFEGCNARKNIEIGAVSFKIPDNFSGEISVKLTVDGHPEYSSEYLFPCKNLLDVKKSKAQILNF